MPWMIKRQRLIKYITDARAQDGGKPAHLDWPSETLHHPHQEPHHVSHTTTTKASATGLLAHEAAGNHVATRIWGQSRSRAA